MVGATGGLRLGYVTRRAKSNNGQGIKTKIFECVFSELERRISSPPFTWQCVPSLFKFHVHVIG